MDRVAFTAPEYQADGTIRPAAYAFAGSTADGWEIRREGRPHLRLGPGYRLLQSVRCGICATDLARRHLPFPLPQVTGHEVVADDDGRPAVVEINASHAARGLPADQQCAFCRGGLATHCPDRLVLGIHDLPGGFSPWLLAPVDAVIPVPAGIAPATAALTEPFAAALQAIVRIAPRDGDRIAVLGPRRLGALLVAALARWRRQQGRRIEIIAIARRPALRALARDLGADTLLDAATVHDPLAEVVIDTTGSPDGFALATSLATREVHVKSTTGQPAGGLAHLTAAVVDELTIAPYAPEHIPAGGGVVALLGDVPGPVARDLAARGYRVGDAAADVAVVGSLAAIDAAIRPHPGVERGLVRPRGTILVVDVGQPRDGVLDAVLGRGLRLGTSRCGDLRAALALLAPPAPGPDLGDRLVTAHRPATQLAEAFAAAADPSQVKVVIEHDGASA